MGSRKDDVTGFLSPPVNGIDAVMSQASRYLIRVKRGAVILKKADGASGGAADLKLIGGSGIVLHFDGTVARGIKVRKGCFTQSNPV